MNRYKTFTSAFNATLPVLAGYLATGIAFGLVLDSSGFGALWALFMSFIVYAGSAQFLGVELLRTGAGLLQIALLTLLVNFRHVVYGLSKLQKFHGMGLLKPYMIFSLTDETYALLSGVVPPVYANAKRFYFFIAVISHFYWVLGSVIGCAAGEFLNFSTQGVEFAMTALFIVIAVEQCLSYASHLPAVIGTAAALLSVLVFGADNMLLPALFIIVASLLIFRRKLDFAGLVPESGGGEEVR